ncbi:hypothetical protein V2E39_06810 [Chryseobacterium arthrosphaerae]|uniref:TonB C-terminal domain-containing protein n=1 Tax=Chryseobacterium arthrosphaerae TaxID=651561 RepID=A0A1B8ZIB5_9FLAO|nr:hypothetical protein [Chryseobacterium arthrosphaerae]AYZ14476.1 hypothetical protein EGY05_22255 [Chryseobacterium arthrosphaerae]MDG4651571.1 hypothetical protein [Chryseobacterium arthrosphaerae]OCA71306.1 hypothetical protein BBI00_16415 [Chryseobacterium arthrosphaerae]
MKKIVIFIAFLGFGLAFSQEKKTEEPSDYPPKGAVSEERKQAEYPGGINTFMRDVFKKINTKKLKGGAGKAQANARFSVNTQGEIDKLVVTGNNETVNKEVERVMRSMKTKWVPGELKGNPVETMYNLPFIVNFD